MSMRILIADDHGIMRAGLRALLDTEPDLEVIGEAEDGKHALQLARALKPDIILMDISMPGCSGIEATRLLAEHCPQTRVLILTMHDDKSLLQAAIQSGASGYVLKRAVESELINAVRAVARGDLYVHSSMTRALLETASYTPSPKGDAVENLTPREVEVLQLIASGYTNRQIAEKLTVSVRTVESHRANLIDKLGIRTRVELLRYAIENGLLVPGDF